MAASIPFPILRSTVFSLPRTLQTNAQAQEPAAQTQNLLERIWSAFKQIMQILKNTFIFLHNHCKTQSPVPGTLIQGREEGRGVRG